MEAEFWHRRWRDNQIAFHLPEVNPNLVAHWPGVAAPGGHVFVPLCGKSRDLAWLARRGHRVTGVELSDIAVREFLRENGLAATPARAGEFARYRAGAITLLCGDFFALRGADLGAVDAVYDRAALIALPPRERARYAAALADLATGGSTLLLVSLEYRQRDMRGPPFAVHPGEVRRLFAGAFTLTELAAGDETEAPPGLAARGLRAMRERVWLGRRR